MDEHSEHEKRNRFEGFLVYALGVIVAMLSWFMLSIYNKLDFVALEQARRTSAVQSMHSLSMEIKALEKSVYDVNLTKGWVEDLRRRVDALERSVYSQEKKP